MHISRLLAGAMALAAPLPLLAQTGSPIDRQRADRAQPQAQEPVQDAPAAATRVDAGDETAPPIANIAFEGTNVPLAVAEAAQPFVGRPATRANLQALVGAMSEAYGRTEVALFTIVVPEQDLSTGNVRVLVAEGHLETVVLTGEVEGRSLRLVRAYADRLTRQRPTRRATLERYLSLIRDIPGLAVTPSLQTGEGPGGVRMLLALDYKKPTLSFSFDNRTTTLVRDGQFQARARAFGLLREGDETEVNGAASVDFNDLLYIGATHSTPLGTEGTRLALTGGWLVTRPPNSGLRGEAKTLGLVLSHPVIRGYRRNLSVSLSLDGLNSDNAAFGSLITSERTRAVRAAAGYSQTGRRRAFSAGLTASLGLDILGAEIPAAIGQPDFIKLNARAGLDQAVGRRAVLRLRGAGQWTRDALPAAERFSVGGAEFGRAFETGLVNADRGYAGLAEFAFRPIRSGRFAASELYAFGDYAAVRFLARPAFAGQDLDLASAGGGVRLAFTNRAMVEFEVARTVDRPYPFYPSDWRFSVGWRISLRP
jgi:hemolysin activation/secretion protein